MLKVLIEIDYSDGNYGMFRPCEYYKDWKPESMIMRERIWVWTWAAYCVHRFFARAWYHYMQNLSNVMYERDHSHD